MLTSIIIPTYQHCALVCDAIDSALAQTAEVEVIVVDDGSTDGTVDRVLPYAMRDPRVRISAIAHAGPSAARNVGLEEVRGEFVMFLDADDLIAPDKVELQLIEMEDPGVGWVLCDVRIEPVGGRPTFASKQYGYHLKFADGWIQPLLVAGNFIPIMSPLIRRSALGAIRFHEERTPEDWHFWHELAGVARCRYVDVVLATYRKQPQSRNTTTKPHPAKRPGVEPPLRLNLGCGTPDTRSWHPMPGMVNLDRSMGWKFEDGLGEFVDGSVAGITVSHALMYLALEDWPRVFAEFARVLQPGGVLRITEDDTSTPGSSRIGGWHGSEPAVALTDAAMVRRYMEGAGFTVNDVTAGSTVYKDVTLCQAQHGEAPDVFFIEGVRECSLLLAPHSDDETLFAAFTIIRHRPQVVLCFASSGDYGDTATRLAESQRAVAILGGGRVRQWDGTRLVERMRDLDTTLLPTRVFAPSTMTSHGDHLTVANAAGDVFGKRLTRYHTYTDNGKVRLGVPVAFEQSWVDLKRQALACYRTQLQHPRARAFFDDDLAEYQE